MELKSTRAMLMALTAVALPVLLASQASGAPRKSTKAKPARSEAPSKQIIEQRMRALWEKKAASGSDGATTVTIHSVVVGSPRPWSILDGGGGKPGTKVYPAKVHWTLRTHYRTRTNVRERRWVVSCFKNGFNEWVVQRNGEPGQTDEVRDEPSTME